MKINEAVIMERMVEPQQSFFSDYDNKIIVYERPLGKKDDIIIHSIIDGRHEFTRKEGNRTTTISKANRGDKKKLGEMREWLINEGYRFNQRFNWLKLLAGLGFGAFIGATFRSIRQKFRPTKPEDVTSIGIDAQHIKDINPTIDLQGVPTEYLSNMVKDSINRFGVLDLNTLEHKIEQLAELRNTTDYGQTISGWEILLRWIETW